MNKVCRVLLTTQCNLKCSYCCNKIPEIQRSFKMTTFDEFIKKAKDYSDINISGGEPLLVPDKLTELTSELYTLTNAKLWLYTNGLANVDDTTLKHLKRFNGINIGCHDNFEILRYVILNWKYRHGLERLRLHVQDTKCTPEIELFCQENEIDLKKWKMNQCDNVEEDRFIV